ncbi:MAG: hypothetical protein H0V34_14770 [Gammaproteobacteria bacterium]|nr:hypothetical protein [Gammaproteobacteria bacterium]
MKLKLLSIGTILSVALVTANAADQFSTLEGVQTEPMSSAEIESVQGKNDFFGDQMAQLQASFNQAGASMQQAQQQLMSNPYVQQQYNQYLQTGGTNSFEQFAYFFGGSPAAQAGYIASGQAGLNGVGQAMNGFNEAITADGISRSNTATNFGNVLTNTGTYQDPNGSNYILPYTWQPDTFNSYNNQTYYVDSYGQYYQLDPSGYGYPVYPTYGQ